MAIYVYNTDLGTFEITNQHHRGFELWLEDEKLGEYASAEEAAIDVASFNTGHLEWDDLESELHRVPANLSYWRQVQTDTPDAVY